MLSVRYYVTLHTLIAMAKSGASGICSSCSMVVSLRSQSRKKDRAGSVVGIIYIKSEDRESLRNALNPDPEAFIWLNGDNVFNAECGHWQWRDGAA